jgi:hypothetical protein
LDKNKNTILAGKDQDQIPYFLADVYQEVNDGDHSVPIKTLPANVLTCKDGPSDTSELKLGDVMEKSPDKKQEQLGWFVPSQMRLSDNWYSPACKPAINLYPIKDTVVNVKINIPHGFLTYTDPLYPESSGWNVLAHPNGELQYLSSGLASSKGVINYPTGVFPYLYYEGKIQDQAVTKPDKGFMESYDQLDNSFDKLLPKLGLNTKESLEFKQYWLKALPKANYYFIGIIPQEQVNANEPLTITPKQDTIIRVRLYFEPLDKPKLIEQPTIQTPSRTGFTVVDWGGMVKRDKDHPFTCLQ